MPALVVCSISGYGQDGPYKERAGHDLNYAALAGVLRVDRCGCGEREDHALGALAPAPGEAGAAPSGGGVALIAVDGKPARPYRIGAALDDGLVLQALGRRSASIGPPGGAASMLLELPPPAQPATGTLPVASAESPPAAVQGAPAAPQAVQEEAEPLAPMPAPRGEQPRNAVLR